MASAAVTMVTSEQLSLVSFYRKGSTCLAFPEAHSAPPGNTTQRIRQIPRAPESGNQSLLVGQPALATV